MTYRSILMAGLAAGIFASVGGLASTADAQAAGASTGTTIGEVVVTARRRSESLQRVPTAIVAFNQKMLTEKAIVTAYDLNRAVPGLTVEASSANPSLPIFAIRGRGQNYGAAAGSVETYFAEVPLSAPFQEPTLPPQFFDMQSVQVLKGPQGTLFGRNTTGGAILLVPQAPTDSFGGYARIQGGTYDDFQFEAAVNVPLIQDKASLRVALFDWQRDGYMHSPAGVVNALSYVATAGLGPFTYLPAQTFNNVDTTEFRATLLLHPIEALENSTLFTYHYDQTRASAGAGLNRVGPLAIPGSRPIGNGVYDSPGEGSYTAPIDINLTKPGSKIWALINTTTYTLNSNLSLKNIFGYIHSEGYGNDGDSSYGTDFPPISIDLLVPPRPKVNDQTTDEFQVRGNDFGNRLTWVAGGLLDETREPGGLTTMNIANSSLNFGNETTTFEENTFNSYGAFVAGTFKITDQLDINAGYRHSWDDIQFNSEQQAGLSGTVMPTPGNPISHYSKDFQGNTYDASLDFHLTQHVMLYGGYRRGYKRGGFNESQTNPALASFGPETDDDYFAGVKSDFTVFDMPGRINVEGYYDLYQDEQISYLGSNGQNLTTITANVPKTTFRGFDTDFALDVTHWMTLSGNYSYIDAFNTLWPDNTGAPGQPAHNLAVNPVPFVSKNKVSFTARLHTQLSGNRGELVFAPTINYQDKFYELPVAITEPYAEQAVFGGDFNNIAHGGDIIPGYTTVDLRAEWNHLMGSKIDAALNVTNLTNKLFILSTAGTLGFGVEGYAYGPPRMVSFELSTRF